MATGVPVEVTVEPQFELLDPGPEAGGNPIQLPGLFCLLLAHGPGVGEVLILFP